MDIERMINMHMKWKARFETALRQRIWLDAGAIAVDKGCLLSNWLHGEGWARYGFSRAWSDCVAAHSNFHRQAAIAVQQINERFDLPVQEALGGASPYALASQALEKALVRLRQEGRPEQDDGARKGAAVPSSRRVVDGAPPGREHRP
ncbi:CZB domain-containing protein [Chitiniphilus eburneus]|nr:CZB domain-containing protein [Chitiniphilus eburneus]